MNKWLKKIANTLGTVIGVLAETVGSVVATIKESYDAYRQRGGATQQAARSELERKRDRLRELNDEILSLRNRAMGGGGLTDAQRNRWQRLRAEREELLDSMNEVREVQAAEKVLSSEERIQKVEVELETSHVLQWNAFADILGKTCSQCGRPMKVQWDRKLARPGPRDFYWGCTGWYVLAPDGSHACSNKAKLSRDDLGLMTDVTEPEFSVKASDLDTILAHNDTQKVIIERMDDLRSDLSARHAGVELATCPVHGANMVLRRKAKPTGLLDTYFLACPYWSSDNTGCGFIEKLKSGAQLAALLKSETGQGVL